MASFRVGDVVTVRLPRGYNKRGVQGISVMYTTREEARFDGATGTITQINPRGPFSLPNYLVDFRNHDNKVAIPWQAQWFREEWLQSADAPKPRQEAVIDPAAAGRSGEFASATGQGQTSTGEAREN